jgi:hypothetical protein
MTVVHQDAFVVPFGDSESETVSITTGSRPPPPTRIASFLVNYPLNPEDDVLPPALNSSDLLLICQFTDEIEMDCVRRRSKADASPPLVLGLGIIGLPGIRIRIHGRVFAELGDQGKDPGKVESLSRRLVLYGRGWIISFTS